MATFEDILTRMGTASVLSTLDLAKGYHQVPADNDSVEKTSFLTPYGKYAYKNIPSDIKCTSHFPTVDG